MPEKYLTSQARDLILKAEIAALFHDIGKFTVEFLTSKLIPKGKYFDHAWGFFEDPLNTPCQLPLKQILTQPFTKGFLDLPANGVNLRILGDLIRFHHEGNTKRIKEILEWSEGQPLPLALALLMIADSIDSSSSKGGAEFKIQKGKREPRLDENLFLQSKDSCYLATPFGEKEKGIDLEEVDKQSKQFQTELTHLLTGFEDWNPDELRNERGKIFILMEKYLSHELAETRLPTNDVSLWQHSYSTASIFKAMLARHLILEEYSADDNTNLSHYKEKLAFLGIRWSEDDLLSRTMRPKDILGRRARLFNLMEALKEEVELDFCLGNETYRDRNGVCFLIPSIDEDPKTRQLVNELLDRLENLLNNENYFPGDLQYRILSKEVGIQILGLTDVLSGSSNELRRGPKKPNWINTWKSAESSREICSRCGFRPILMVPSSIGSEQDEGKVCEFCRDLAKEAAELRSKFKGKVAQQLLGTDSMSDYFVYETDKLLEEGDENQRLALVQGFFDLRPFISSLAFASILAREPDDYYKVPGSADKSLEMNTWGNLLTLISNSWKQAQTGVIDDAHRHNFQQLFHDTYLGTERDGRVPGTPDEKLLKYLKQIVIESFFPKSLKENQKIVLYALRQHPAPSRLSRVWEQTGKLCRQAVAWCEQNKVRYVPLSMDPSRFLILVPAKNARQFVNGIYKIYEAGAGKVRHLLPFHLSAAVFNKKFPLYIGLDAMRRFSGLQLNKAEPKLWCLEKKEMIEYFCLLEWRDHHNRKVTWKMPLQMSNGAKERFYTWFWIDGYDHPVAMEDEVLQPGVRVLVWPSTFDYEVLDTTVRRYDIRCGESRELRPHLFCGDDGPRPYPFEDLEVWEGNEETKLLFDKVESHQVHRLMAMVGDLHTQWRGCESAVLENQVKDLVTLTIGKDLPKISEMAVSGALFDAAEWEYLISK